MNIQAETNQDKDKGLVYNHHKARVLATIITTFNKHMEYTVEQQGQQYIVTYSLKASINITENVAKDTSKGSLFDCQENVSRYTYYCLNNQCEY